MLLEELKYMGIFIILIIIAFIIICCAASENDRQNREQEREEEIKKSSEYSKYMQKYKRLVTKYQNSEYYLKAGKYAERKHYAILNNSINILEDLDEDDITDKISAGEDAPNETIYDIDKIKYYKLAGSVYQQQHISGGGGGGSSLGGAVVGGLVAGGVGAIIGSRNKIDDVQTTYITKDDRRVVLTFIDEEEVELPYKFYDRLLDYIPEKEYDNYIALKKSKRKK